MKWLFAVDESGSKQTAVSGFGALMMNWDRRGDIRQLVQQTVQKYPHHQGELKWSKVKNAPTFDLASDLVEQFFKARWLTFHCMVVRRGLIRRELHRDYDEAWRKNLCLFLVNKAKLCDEHFPDDDHVVHVWADQIPTKYQKTAEALDVIGNRKLQHRSVSIKVFEHDSKRQPAIQLCDLLLGAVVQSFAQQSNVGRKRQLQDLIAEHLGWSELSHGTYRTQPKFNIWHLHDHGQVRRIPAARVALKYGANPI